MTNITMNQTVKVTMKGLVEDTTFIGKVVDMNNSGSLIWVERDNDSDWVMVNLNNPKINTIESYEVEVEENQDMKSIKADLLKAIKWLDDVSVRVMVYDCTESGRQTYDIEINYYVDGEYQDGFYNQTFVGRYEDDQLATKQAVQRAKAVLRTVKGWFKNNDDVTVMDGIEVYHA